MSVILHALSTGLEAGRHPSPMHSQRIYAKLCIHSSGRCTPRYAQDAAQEIPVHLLAGSAHRRLVVPLQQVPNQTLPAVLSRWHLVVLHEDGSGALYNNNFRRTAGHSWGPDDRFIESSRVVHL